MKAIEIFEKLWKDYFDLNPIVGQVVKLLENQGEKLVNDHIALRTFQHESVGIRKLSEPFLAAGYVAKDQYDFETKKLHAQYFSHPDKNLPRVFISELKIKQFSKWLQDNILSLIECCKKLNGLDLLFSKNKWGPIPFETYLTFLGESEYAAWMSIFGFRANHFTVDFNKLKSWDSLEDFNSYLKENQITLNSSGGEIKGSPKVFLEQSSTLASKIKVSFADKSEVVPCCYFEFAKRYNTPNGQLYDGFIADSADKIFESTDAKK